MEVMANDFHASGSYWHGLGWVRSGRLVSIYHEDTDKGGGVVLSIDRISFESGGEQSSRINLVEAVSKPWPICL